MPRAGRRDGGWAARVHYGVRGAAWGDPDRHRCALRHHRRGASRRQPPSQPQRPSHWRSFARPVAGRERTGAPPLVQLSEAHGARPGSGPRTAGRGCTRPRSGGRPGRCYPRRGRRHPPGKTRRTPGTRAGARRGRHRRGG